MRVFELARELGVTSKIMLDKCRAEGVDLKNHMAALSAGLEATIREWFSETAASTAVETSQHVDMEQARAHASKTRRRRGKGDEESVESAPPPEAPAPEPEEAPAPEPEEALEPPTHHVSVVEAVEAVEAVEQAPEPEVLTPEPEPLPAEATPAAEELPPPSTPEKPKFSKEQIAGRVKQLKILFEDYLLTDDFYDARVAECEAGQ
ncbi:MAG: translation initiation factor IF-2 N-terminal domain-containing protein [Planctomycetota bacterium]